MDSWDVIRDNVRGLQDGMKMVVEWIEDDESPKRIIDYLENEVAESLS